MNSCFDELNNALQEMVEIYDELMECIKNVSGNLPECSTYGISYASELSMHPV